MLDRLTAAPIELGALIAASQDDACGALAIFVGTVRDENDGYPVRAITYEAQPLLARKILASIEEEARERFAIRSCLIVHRIGLLGLGEASVAIVVRSAHRDAAFTALRFAIEAVKTRAPIWKLEHYRDGSDCYLRGVSLLNSLGERP